jgi:hypothetical protein
VATGELRARLDLVGYIELENLWNIRARLACVKTLVASSSVLLLMEEKDVSLFFKNKILLLLLA